MTENTERRTEIAGFSLVELLVVISIIAAVLAILIPGIGKTRILSQRTKCASNLHQIDIAIHLYLSSNDDKYPCAQDPISANPLYWLWMGRGWREFIAPYTGGKIDVNNPSILLCPADRTEPARFELTSYSYSMAFYHSPEQINEMNSVAFTYSSSLLKKPVPQKVVDVGRPDGKIIIGEWFSNHKKINLIDEQGWWNLIGQRNFLFADGQVRFLKAQDIRTANDGNPNPNLTKNGIKGIDWQKN
jgi:prepilin-type N-terminal cleavage/methylation domain-containing protein/prepilin-type processing-associated H-X9-DG protein